MTVQDDRRENELMTLFKLQKPVNATRSGTDAVLYFNERYIPFELKSTTSYSVTTVRDFGLSHIQKWQGKHWLFGFYSKDGTTLNYCLYGSPQAMEKWISEKEAYILPDYKLAQLAPELLTINVLYEILGQKQVYTLEDARRLQKKQYTIEQYRNQMDLTQGYSPERMLSILQDRCRYLIERGSTLNNPHIPASYFQGWKPITENHAPRLRKLVAAALEDKA